MYQSSDTIKWRWRIIKIWEKKSLVNWENVKLWLITYGSWLLYTRKVRAKFLFYTLIQGIVSSPRWLIQLRKQLPPIALVVIRTSCFKLIQLAQSQYKHCISLYVLVYLTRTRIWFLLLICRLPWWTIL